MEELLKAVVMGILEGVTEFLPVSSTGHLILADKLIDFQGPSGNVFEVVIQLGAILAVCVLYFGRLSKVAFTLHSSSESRRFVLSIILAFLPAAIIGLMLHKFIKAVLFSPYVVCISLVVGGIAILLIERMKHKPKVHEVEEFPHKLSVGIGFAQCLAMIPGISRSGATILGGMMMGADRKAAAEFSFFLAIPTMLGASALDLYKNFSHITAGDAGTIAVGFIAAFISAMIVVRSFIAFITRYGFAPFGWYRIAVGAAGFLILMM